jgi:hypothetical protein
LWTEALRQAEDEAGRVAGGHPGTQGAELAAVRGEPRVAGADGGGLLA